MLLGISDSYIDLNIVRLKVANIHAVFVTIVFSADRLFHRPNSSCAYVSILVHTHSCKTAVRFFAAVGSIAADHCHCMLLASFILPTARHSDFKRYCRTAHVHMAYTLLTTAVKYWNANTFHILVAEINMVYELYKHVNFLSFLNSFTEMHKRRQFNFMIGKHYEKTSLFENERLSFYHSSTIKFQCKNLTFIHITWRGQLPNDRMMIM